MFQVCADISYWWDRTLQMPCQCYREDATAECHTGLPLSSYWRRPNLAFFGVFLSTFWSCYFFLGQSGYSGLEPKRSRRREACGRPVQVNNARNWSHYSLHFLVWLTHGLFLMLVHLYLTSYDSCRLVDWLGSWPTPQAKLLASFVMEILQVTNRFVNQNSTWSYRESYFLRKWGRRG